MTDEDLKQSLSAQVGARLMFLGLGLVDASKHPGPHFEETRTFCDAVAQDIIDLLHAGEQK